MLRMRRAGTWILAAIALVTLAACSSGDDAKPAAPSAQSPGASGSPSSSSTGATALGRFTLEGDTGLTGDVTSATVRCPFPNIVGPNIAMITTAPDSTLQIRIAIRADHVLVQVSSGSGTSYAQRDFEGAGVSGFDARTGAQVDSALAEIPVLGGTTPPGTIGAVRSIKGSVDCGDQDPGSTTVKITGDLAAGHVEGASLTDVRVECNPTGNELVVLGILDVGGTRVFFSAAFRPEGVNVFELGADNVAYQYQPSGGGATVTPTGGLAAGAASDLTASPPRTVRVEGDAVCGSTI